MLKKLATAVIRGLRHGFLNYQLHQNLFIMKRTEKEELALEQALEREINAKTDSKRLEMEVKKKQERGVIPEAKVHNVTSHRKGTKNIDPLNQAHKERGQLDSGSGRDRAANRNNK